MDGLGAEYRGGSYSILQQPVRKLPIRPVPYNLNPFPSTLSTVVSSPPILLLTSHSQQFYTVFLKRAVRISLNCKKMTRADGAYNRPAHLSHSVGCMKPNLQGLVCFECREISKEELLARFMYNL